MSRCLVLLGALALLGAAPLTAGPGSWTSLGPEGGSIRSLRASPSAPGTVWAISSFGRVFKTTDGAATWTPVTSLQNRGVFDLLPDPSNASILYIHDFESVLKSVDGGATWEPADEGLASHIYDLAIAPSQPATLYAAGSEQIFKSIDGGAHWLAVSELRFPGSLAVSPADPTTVLVLSQDRVLRSRDSGAHWEEIPGPGARIPLQVAFDPKQPQTLYALTLLDDLLRSDDAGATWHPANEGLSDLFLGSFVIDPSSSETLWIAGSANRSADAVWRSDDRGEHWTKVYAGLAAYDVALDPVAGVLLGTARAGVLQSQDGGLHWTAAHRGLTAIAVTELAVAPDGTIWSNGNGESSPFFYAKNGLFRSLDRGATWDDLTPGEIFQATGIAVSPRDSATIHVSVYGGVYNSRDGGGTWKLSRQGLRLGEILWGIALAPSQPEILYTGGIGSPVCDTQICGQFRLFKSADGGTTWRRARKGLPRRQSLGSFLVHPSRPGTAWAGGDGLYRTTDGGESWTPLGRGLPGFIRDLAVVSAVPDTLYAAVSQAQGRRVFKSVNGGVTWRHAADGLPVSAEVWTLALDPTRPATFYAATTAGVFVTDDGGTRWRPLDGLSSAFTVSVDPSDPRTIYAGTDAGLFVLTRTDL
jgi:photosystem II stability/assembly factor-like uncharacterized protein